MKEDQRFKHLRDEINRYRTSFERSQDHVRSLEKRIVELEEEIERLDTRNNNLVRRKPFLMYPKKEEKQVKPLEDWL